MRDAMSVVVLISGRGSNLESILRAAVPVAAVISNEAGAGGLQIAERHGVPARSCPIASTRRAKAFDAALAAEIDRFAPKLVAMAGFMRIVTPEFVARYSSRLVNIHPSLLPAFPGLSTHARALAAGVKVHGCTVHFVTRELDHGPIIVQAAVPVLAGDTAQVLAARVLREEHQVYPIAIRWFLEGRLVSENGVVRVLGNDAQLVYSARA
jgi:phosphoribosylglycinamide formyltransferase-1